MWGSKNPDNAEIGQKDSFAKPSYIDPFSQWTGNINGFKISETGYNLFQNFIYPYGFHQNSLQIIKQRMIPIVRK